MKKNTEIVHIDTYVTSEALYGRYSVDLIDGENVVFVKKLGGYIPEIMLEPVGQGNRKGRYYRLKKSRIMSMIPDKNLVKINNSSGRSLYERSLCFWVKADYLIPYDSYLKKIEK